MLLKLLAVFLVVSGEVAGEELSKYNLKQLA